MAGHPEDEGRSGLQRLRGRNVSRPREFQWRASARPLDEPLQVLDLTMLHRDELHPLRVAELVELLVDLPDLDLGLQVDLVVVLGRTRSFSLCRFWLIMITGAGARRGSTDQVQEM